MFLGDVRETFPPLPRLHLHVAACLGTINKLGLRPDNSGLDKTKAEKKCRGLVLAISELVRLLLIGTQPPSCSSNHNSLLLGASMGNPTEPLKGDHSGVLLAHTLTYVLLTSNPCYPRSYGDG